jgi:lysozyme family protein
VDEGGPSEFFEIYETAYWRAAKCDKMPEPLDLLHFDAAVNYGVGTANKILQTALGLVGVDGIVGPKTLDALKNADKRVLYGRYCNLRISRYIVLATMDTQKRVFLGGWLRRVGELLQVA